MEQGTGQTALLIVDLSSLDSYTDRHGVPAGEELGYVLGDAIGLWSGPVFLTDQGWEDAGRVSRPRRGLEEAIAGSANVTRFPFDEDTGDWEEAMLRLGDLLRGQGVTGLVLGGLWATVDGSSGGVNEACRQLSQQGFACRIDFSLCGMDEDAEGGGAACPCA